MSPQAQKFKEYELARLEYLVEDGFSQFEKPLAKARRRSDKKWEKQATRHKQSQQT